MLIRGKFFVGGRVPPLVVEFSERAGGDVAVLRKPLILNPAGTEGQVLINARIQHFVSSLADLSLAILQTLSERACFADNFQTSSWTGEMFAKDCRG
jgi:hypothetical protein